LLGELVISICWLRQQIAGAAGGQLLLGCRIEMQGVASPGKCSARSLAINVVLLHSIMMLHFNAHTGHTHTNTRDAYQEEGQLDKVPAGWRNTDY
jgi:hypothetical protein